MPKNHLIIIGGVSVNDPTHDGSPWNFINPGIRRAKALKSSVAVIFYTPGYERRVNGQKNEHSSVTNPKKDKDYFAKTTESAARKHGATFHKIASAADLTKKIKSFQGIETIDFFGHSNAQSIFLEYSSITTGVSQDMWNVTNAAKIATSQFNSGAVFASYGCNQGDPGGLAEKLRETWQIKTIGSRGKTDFRITGPFGGPTFPTSAQGYVAYPAPTVNSSGQLVRPLPSAKSLTYSKTNPPS